MVFGESPAKDAYRLMVWGPYRWGLEAGPPLAELRANRALGRLAFRASRGRRDLVRANMRRALGPSPDLDRWVRESFETHFCNQYVGITFAKVGRENWGDYLRLEGRELLDQALARGRGVVLAHPHMALPQLPLHVLGLLGYDVHQVGGGKPKVELSPVGERVAALRASLESRIEATLHDGKGYLRPLLRVLGANGVVLTACDGTGGGEELGRREAFEVLGERMLLPVSAEWLAKKSGATLLTMFPRRNRGPGPPFVATIEAPVEGGTAEIGRRLERWLRHSPGDWHFWDAWHEREGGLLGAPERG